MHALWKLVYPASLPEHKASRKRRPRREWGRRKMPSCMYRTKYTKYNQYIDKYWTSFWSPIGSIWELRTKFSRHFDCLFVPRLFGVCKNMHKHEILVQIHVVVKNGHLGSYSKHPDPSPPLYCICKGIPSIGQRHVTLHPKKQNFWYEFINQ